MIAVQHTAGVISTLRSHDLVASTTHPNEIPGLADVKTSIDTTLTQPSMVCWAPLRTS